MSVIGIVGEYDPFHYGHKHHIEKTKELLGEDCPTVCVMSGDFIQRGEAAVYSKFARAEAACRSGVDLVLELPLPWVLSSAEGFARGAVGILGATGVVTHLSFGSECGEVSALAQIAETLMDPAMGGDIRTELENDEGISFAAARERAVAKKLGDAAQLLRMPNNILAVEYIKAIYAQGLSLKPVTVQRFGSGHDGSANEGPRSASEIRRALADGKNIEAYVPKSAMEIYRREDRLGRGPVLTDDLERVILSRLRFLSDADFARLPDASEGLEKRFAAAARTEVSLDAVLAATKSKRYALSRIRRMALCAALGVTAEMSHDRPPYARVLAANERGCALLKDMNDLCRIPVITKPASVKTADAECAELFGLGSAAHDLYVLGCGAREERRGGLDWRTSPVIIKETR